MRRKLGQTTSAAALVGVVTLVLLAYIVLIPAEDRDSLLGITSNVDVNPSDINSDTTTNVAKDFTFSGPGRVDDAGDGREINLPTVNLKTSTTSKIFVEDNAFYISNGFFSQEIKKTLAFSIKDVTQVDNVRMSFLTKKHEGVIKITLNGFDLYQNDVDTTNIEPIKIDLGMLRSNNVVEITVSDPGMIFWKTNEYIIDDFKVFGDVTETSQQTSMVSFELESSEYKFLKRAQLKFYPDCEQTTVGSLYIKINGRDVYNQIPDCAVLNIYDIPLSTLMNGINTLEFGTYADSYLIDRIVVKTELKENDDLIYYFDLDPVLFNMKNTAKNVCGEIDGVCPDGCSEDEDAECCFLEYTEAYWCDVPTSNSNDRCVGKVDAYNVDDCPSGYEDRNGNPPEDFEERCGDDTDGECPAGCADYYDKDCCLENGDFWCNDLAITGVAGICVKTVSQDSCAYCPTGYEGEDYDPDCSGYESRNVMEEEVELKSSYDVELTMRFVDDGNRKRGVIRVNDFEMSFSTYDSEVVKNIDRFVLDGNNYAQILPDNDFDLVNVKIEVKDS